MQEQMRRRVLVTGGTGALGSAIVRALCIGEGERYYDVVANFRRDESRAQQLQQATGCLLHRADVGDEAEVEALFAPPAFYAVIHAAGVSRDGLLARYPRADWNETQRVNADGAFLVTRAALRSMADGGRLILIASRVAERGGAGQSAYAAAKAALLGLMKVAAREGAERRLCVNAVCPGFIPSDMTASLSESQLSARRATSLTGSFGSAVAVAGTVQWLLSVEAAAISGQVLHCDSRI